MTMAALFQRSSEFEVPTTTLKIRRNLFGTVRFLSGRKLIAEFHGGGGKICLPSGKFFSFSTCWHEGVTPSLYDEAESELISIHDFHHELVKEGEPHSMVTYGTGEPQYWAEGGLTSPAHAELPLDRQCSRVIVVGDRVIATTSCRSQHLFVRKLFQEGKLVATLTVRLGFPWGDSFTCDASIPEVEQVFMALLSMDWNTDPRNRNAGAVGVAGQNASNDNEG